MVKLPCLSNLKPLFDDSVLSLESFSVINIENFVKLSLLSRLSLKTKLRWQMNLHKSIWETWMKKIRECLFHRCSVDIEQFYVQQIQLDGVMRKRKNIMIRMLNFVILLLIISEVTTVDSLWRVFVVWLVWIWSSVIRPITAT